MMHLSQIVQRLQIRYALHSEKHNQLFYESGFADSFTSMFFFKHIFSFIPFSCNKELQGLCPEAIFIPICLPLSL